MSSYVLARVGKYTVCEIDFCGLNYDVYEPGSRPISFPTAKMALDWIRWMEFGIAPSNIYAAIGRWLVDKYRTQVRANDGASAHAILNMKKQGVPREFRQFILEGA